MIHYTCNDCVFDEPCRLAQPDEIESPEYCPNVSGKDGEWATWEIDIEASKEK